MMMRYLDEAVETCENLITQLNAKQSGAEQPAAEPLEPQSWTQACQTVGNILTGMGFVEESYPWRSMALDTHPDSAKFYAESGRVYSQCEIWDRAIYFCQRTLEYQPDNVIVRRRLAKIYNQTGNYHQESQVLNELLTIEPKQTDAEGHHQLGQVMEKQGQTQAAQSCYERAIKQDNQYVAAYYSLGELWTQTAQRYKAITLFKQLIENLNATDSADNNLPSRAMAHYRLGRAYRQNGQLEQAVTQFRQALNLDSHLHWAYMGLLNTLIQMKQWDEVIEPCQKLTHRAKEFPWIYTFMGNAFAGKQDWQQAAAAHQQAFALRGWTQCAERKYEYGRTWFAETIPLWEEHLNDLIQQPAVRAPVQALSLGSHDDAALCWMVDKVLSQDEDRLVCITQRINDSLKNNVTRLSQPTKLTFEIGEISKQLSNNIRKEYFSMIFVQSDRKDAGYLRLLLSQAWEQLQPNGILLIKDYQWKHPEDLSQSSQVGIDAFVTAAGDYATVLHRSHQLIVKKAPPTKNTQQETTDLKEIPNAQ